MAAKILNWEDLLKQEIPFARSSTIKFAPRARHLTYLGCWLLLSDHIVHLLLEFLLCLYSLLLYLHYKARVSCISTMTKKYWNQMLPKGSVGGEAHDLRYDVDTIRKTKDSNKLAAHQGTTKRRQLWRAKCNAQDSWANGSYSVTMGEDNVSPYLHFSNNCQVSIPEICREDILIPLIDGKQFLEQRRTEHYL